MCFCQKRWSKHRMTSCTLNLSLLLFWPNLFVWSFQNLDLGIFLTRKFKDSDSIAHEEGSRETGEDDTFLENDNLQNVLCWFCEFKVRDVFTTFVCSKNVKTTICSFICTSSFKSIIWAKPCVQLMAHHNKGSWTTGWDDVFWVWPSLKSWLLLVLWFQD